MASRSDDFVRQVNELWRQAVVQLEEVKEVIVRSSGRIEADLQKLRFERDKLLKKLGEQTYKLANQGKLPMPVFVKTTVDRLNEVIAALVVQQSGAKKRSSKKASGKKKVAKKSSRKKATAASAG